MLELNQVLRRSQEATEWQNKGGETLITNVRETASSQRGYESGERRAQTGKMSKARLSGVFFEDQAEDVELFPETMGSNR